MYDEKFNADEIFEELRQARYEFEEGEAEIKRRRKRRDQNIRQLKKIVEELYKKNIELVKKLKECEGNGE